jgi:hypothetical protein
MYEIVSNELIVRRFRLRRRRRTPPASAESSAAAAAAQSSSVVAPLSSGSLALDEAGSFVSKIDSCGSFDVPRILAPLKGLIRAGHEACAQAGLDQCETAVLRTGQEALVISCCVDADTHVHVVTMVAADGNRALVELAHSRLQREFHDAQTIASSQRSAAEISA